MSESEDLPESEPELPIVDAARVAGVYEELKQMQIKLDSNPIEFGPRRMNANIAKVRSQLDRVEQIFLQVSQDLHVYKREFNETRALYELEKNNLLFNDLDVRSERSQKEREGKADTKLRTYLDKMRTLELRVYDLEQLMVVIKAKRTDLKDKQGRMRDQMKMIDHDLSMGARWGSKAPPATASGDGDIDSMLSELDSSSGYSDDDVEEEEILKTPPEDKTPLKSAPIEAKIPEFPEVDVDSFLPQEGAKGTDLEIQSSQEDTDGFLEQLDVSKKPSAAHLPQPESIEGLIDTLID